MPGPRLAALRQIRLFFGFGSVGLLLDLPGAHTDLLDEQRDLSGGKLLAFGTKQTEVQEPDLLVLDLDNLVEARILSLGQLESLAEVREGEIGRSHVIRDAYT